MLSAEAAYIYSTGPTAHCQTVAEEVTRVGDKDDQARLDLRVLVQAGMLEHQ